MKHAVVLESGACGSSTCWSTVQEEDMMGVLSTLQTRVVRACVILATGGIKASDGSNSAQKSTVYPPPSDIPSPSSCQHVRPPRPQQCLGLQQSVSSPSHSRYPLISLQDRSLSLSEKSYWSQIRIRPQSPSKSKQQHPRSVRPSPSRSVLLRHLPAVLRPSQFG